MKSAPLVRVWPPPKGDEFDEQLQSLVIFVVVFTIADDDDNRR